MADNDVSKRNCSFCGKPGESGTPFAGGFGALICGECINRFHAMFNDPPDLNAATVPPWERMTDTEMLASLPMIEQTADQVNRFLTDWVGLCRGRKISWAAIGQSLGTSRQAAWERFSQRVQAADLRARRNSTA